MSIRRECSHCGNIGFIATDDDNIKCEECGRKLKVENFYNEDFEVTDEVLEEGDPEMEEERPESE